MIASIILDAVLGIATVLLDNHELLGKSALTTLALSIALGLSMLGLLLIQRPHCTGVGYALIGSSLLQLCLAVVLTWSSDLPNTQEERLAVSWMIIAWSTPPLLLGLLLSTFKTPKLMGLVGSGATLAGCMLLLATAWISWSTFSSFGPMITSAFAVFFCGWTGSLSMLARDSRPAAWQYLGLAGAALTTILWIALSRHTGSVSSLPSFHLAFGIGLGTLLLGLIAFMRILTMPPATRWLPPLTIVIFTATLAAQETAIVLDADWPSDPIARVTLALWILATCSLMTTLILYWVSLWDKSDVTTGGTMLVHCPACGMKQTRPLGYTQCSRCHQPLWLWCQATSCSECSYDLTGNTSPNCPECGKAITVPLTPPVFEA